MSPKSVLYTLAPAGLSLALAGSAAAAVSVTIDQTAPVSLGAPASQVIVGNPSIADVSLTDRLAAARGRTTDSAEGGAAPTGTPNTPAVQNSASDGEAKKRASSKADPFQDLKRTMFLFYMAPLVPFLILGLTLALGVLLGPSMRRTGDRFRDRRAAKRRRWGVLGVSAYLALVVVDFAWMWPIFTGGLLTYDVWHAHMWLPSWV